MTSPAPRRRVPSAATVARAGVFALAGVLSFATVMLLAGCSETAPPGAAPPLTPPPLHAPLTAASQG